MKKTISFDTLNLKLNGIVDQQQFKISGDSGGKFGLLFNNGSSDRPGLVYSPTADGTYAKGWNIRHSGSSFEPIGASSFNPIEFTSANLNSGAIVINTGLDKAELPFGFGYSNEPDSIEVAVGVIRLYYSSIDGTYAVWFAGSSQSMLA